jgi:hypothetical protein
MKIKCSIGFHRWEYYSKNMPIGEAYNVPNLSLSLMKITVHFRYCQRCHKNQQSTNRPSFMGNCWITTDILDKDLRRNVKIDEILNKI